MSDNVNSFESTVDHRTRSSVISQDRSANVANSERKTLPGDQIDPYSRVNTQLATDDPCTKEQIEECSRPKSSTGWIGEKEEDKHDEFDEKETGENVEDGWDDGFDDFDDISENFDETLTESKSSPEDGNEEEKAFASSSDAGIGGTSMSKEKMDLNCDPNYDPESDICETRKRWVNPRPNRPYLRY